MRTVSSSMKMKNDMLFLHAYYAMYIFWTALESIGRSILLNTSNLNDDDSSFMILTHLYCLGQNYATFIR